MVPRVTVRRRASPSMKYVDWRVSARNGRAGGQPRRNKHGSNMQQGNSSVFTVSVNGTWNNLCTHDTQDHNYEQKRNVANKILTSRRPLPVTLCVNAFIYSTAGSAQTVWILALVVQDRMGSVK